MIKMNKLEFTNFVIGEGGSAIWKDIVSNDSKYSKLMESDDEKITEVISENISNLDIESINKLCVKHNLNMQVTDIEAYSCYSCKTVIEWESSHPTNGLIWECEICGKNFCSKCLEETVGRSMCEDDDVICPSCLKSK